ncbi:MAG: M48 family metallopeptidase [Elusimicrobiaceae bacterium]|nr:M48 family metallopeptidase [Elusimicrobiaceae bacterium]
MADIDIETVVSDIKLFIEKLKTDLPEVFSKDKEENSPEEEQLAKETPSGKVLYEGQLLPCEVILEETLKEPTFSLEEGVLTIKINNSSQDLPALVEEWSRAQAQQILPQKVSAWAQKMGVEYNNIVIKDQKTLWGSCSQKKNLNFSYRLIKMPVSIIDYLIVHELAHLIHFDHSPEFWSCVEGYIPNYKEARKWLNTNRYAVMAPCNIKFIPKENV